MSNKAVFLFPGQGAQYPGMAIDLLESGVERVKQLFTMASDMYGKDMAAFLASASPEDLKPTDVCQPAITLANLAAVACLAEKGIKPCGCAGFSLGEYAALASAGVITEEECLTLVIQRGKAMQVDVDKMAAAGGATPGMAAVMGLAPEKVEELLAEWKAGNNPRIQDLHAANFNSPKQTVVGGTSEALAEGEKLFMAAGARRYIRLQVNCPFHTPLLAGAAELFKPHIEKITFKDPKIPLFSNISGKQVFTGEEAKKLAILQITNPIRWSSEEKAIEAAGGIDYLLEPGPGKVLQGLWKDTGSTLPCLAAGTVGDIEKITTEG